MIQSIKRVLIANRGEIAVRIIRTLRDLGVESVAVYSDADAASNHRKMADFAVRLPGRSSAETYLNQDALKDAIRLSGADAVHPGYGFLSEDASFCEMITGLGVKFIGPSVSAMNTMGNKVEAKDLMKKYEVPTVPGSDGQIHSAQELKVLTDKIGFPIILKAAAGGGGRGMREVFEASQLEEAFEACSREAVSYFGNGAVFAERLIQNPRHIEIQVLCDGKNGVHLFERDCSVQRRHQKLLEEAPSQFLSDEKRQELGSLAVKAALAVGYEGVGTVEFICESPDDVYFMEMNTRIQVEHPVTEMITGVDLIREQILVADGQALTMQQEHIIPRGWAFEARINAEDPTQDFMPSPGTIKHLKLPEGPFVRVDTHIYAGYQIPSEYDSMIAKVITWGPSRDIAMDRLKRALSEMEIGGITTTARFHEAVISNEVFRSGKFTTHFINDQRDQLQASMENWQESAMIDGALVSAALSQAASDQSVSEPSKHTRQAWAQKAIAESHHHY
ncbi:acetyl-CoA carboxylase biotin carboxylase subunit [Pseudobacteriovorax antillogorgiicola]|uniref:Biotin carboxylase /acetyl-CoA carboxylase carboxyltransferase subunit alpha n=1 Tax=Pseudobacteriovorax antillogorgiicola TaxID=1513793 RepID=A0A1Y6CRS2_9BACT|nr:acetyl-CoA carboxylase biotin carboxylase subunit [Pseudobacteriovorax antillogorgiicola]TCS45877.1 biotin carboxylase /acetyl-CoA carboxylase carboxyltransferase subunit alpha [Pseudobacteriovorax antillogorgiicola]SMF71253.1 biotin carboxylase /acetyl-CoA carboxylase carboxyltransferase subunit alpha [Pseudobacteriovorax antillogorgiicola]